MKSTERQGRMRELLAQTRAQAEHVLRREPAETPIAPAKTHMTVDDHAQWQRSFTADPEHLDINDDLFNVDPYSGDPPSRRSDKELGRVLAILDELESGRGRNV